MQEHLVLDDFNLVPQGFSKFIFDTQGIPTVYPRYTWGRPGKNGRKIV